MSAPYEAVILAAGAGTRMDDGTNIPKSLLPIGPRSLADATETCFLRRQCEQLRQLGVKRVVVVVGYEKEKVIEAINSWDLGIQTVVNVVFPGLPSGSLHSFQFAVRAGIGVLDGTHQTLMMDADIVYDRRVLALFLASKETTSVLVASHCTGADEEVLVYGPTEAPRFMGKGLTPALVNNQPRLGEATGIVKFAPQDHDLARETIDWMVGDPDAPEGTLPRTGFGPAKVMTEHEELTQRFMRYGRVRAVLFGPELGFMEVDDPDEYAHLRKVLYPRLLEQEVTE